MEYKSENSGSRKKSAKIYGKNSSDFIESETAAESQSKDRVENLLKQWGNKQAIDNISLPANFGCKISSQHASEQITKQADDKVLLFLKRVTKIAACFALLAIGYFIRANSEYLNKQFFDEKIYAKNNISEPKNSDQDANNKLTGYQITSADIDKVLKFYAFSNFTQVDQSTNNRKVQGYLDQIAALEQKIARLENSTSNKIVRAIKKIGNPDKILDDYVDLRKLKKKIASTFKIKIDKSSPDFMIELRDKLRGMKKQVKLALKEIEKQRKANEYLVLEREQLKTSLACIDQQHTDVKKISIYMLIDQFGDGKSGLEGVQQVVKSLKILDNCAKIQKNIKDDQTRKLINKSEIFLTRIKLCDVSEDKIIDSIKKDIKKSRIDEKLLALAKKMDDSQEKKILLKLVVILGGANYVL